MATLLDRRPFLLLLIVAAALPLAIPAVPPLIDLGGHVGRYAVQLDGGASPVLRQWYTFEWGLLPNLGCDLLVEALAPVLGLEPAVRLIVAGIAALQAAGFLLLARVAHGRVPPTALFALPLVYGFPLHYGFVKFALGIALACLALALWLRLGDAGRGRARVLVFVPLGCVLWTCHLVGWAVFCVAAFADGLAREHDRGRPWWQAILHAGLPLAALLVAPAIGFAFAAGGDPAQLFSYDRAAQKLTWVLAVMRDRWMLWDMASAVALVVLAGWFWRSPRFERHRGLAVAALLMLAIYAVMPGTLLGSAFADMRLVPVTLAFFLIAARPAPGSSRAFVGWLTIAGLLFAGARLAGNAASLWSHDRQFRQTLAALRHLPEGSNVLTFQVKRCGSAPWAMDRRNHLSGYALARRHAFDNLQWELPGGQLLRIHNDAARPFDRAPGYAIYDRRCGRSLGLADALHATPSAIGYLWVIGLPARAQHPGWSVIGRSGDSAILRRVPAATGRDDLASGATEARERMRGG